MKCGVSSTWKQWDPKGLNVAPKSNPFVVVTCPAAVVVCPLTQKGIRDPNLRDWWLNANEKGKGQHFILAVPKTTEESSQLI